MKKHFVKILFGLLPFVASSCIEDTWTPLGDAGKTTISVYGGPENKLFYDAFTTVKKIDLFNIRRNANSVASLQSSSAVKLTAAPDILAKYNKDNGTAYEWLPASIFTLANNPGVTLAGNDLTLNFAPGEFAKDFAINLDGAKWDLSKKYAVAYKIADTGAATLSGDNYVIAFLSAKNRWDGIYEVVDSKMVDVTNAAFKSAFEGGESYTYALETLSPTKCVVKDNTFGLDAPFFVFNTGTGTSYYGAFGLILEFDPATNKIVSATNFHGQPAPNTRSARLDPDGVNTYKNGVIKIKFNMLQPSVVKTAPYVRTTWDETWQFKKAR